MKPFSAKRTGAIPVFFVMIVFFAAIAGMVTYYFNNQGNSPDTPDNNINKFSSYSELEKYVKENYGESSYGALDSVAMRQESAVAKSGAAPAPASASYSSGYDYSQTNIQVAGVDEADIVKSDGKYMYVVSGSNIAIVDAYPAESAKIASKIFFNGTVNEIFINGGKLVIFGQKYESYAQPVPLEKERAIARESMAKIASMPYYRYSPKTSVMIYDTSDKSNPTLSGDITLDGNYYNSRMIGKYVYVIANEPTYYAYAGGQKVQVPEIYSGGVRITPAFPDIYYFGSLPGNVFTTIAAVDLDSNDVTSKVLLTNYAQNMYVSGKNIYITYTKWMNDYDYVDQMVEVILPLVPSGVQAKVNAAMAMEVSKSTKMQAVGEILQNYMNSLSDSDRQALQDAAEAKLDELQQKIAQEREKTVIQKISIDGGNIEYKSNGEVPGNMLNQFSMDEYNGYLRIATTTSASGGFVAMQAATAVAPMVERTAQAQIALPENSVTDNPIAARAEQMVAVSQGAVAGGVSTGNVVASSTATSSFKPSAGITAEEQKLIEKTRPSQVAPMPEGPRNNVYVLDGDLKIVGKLEGLAPGERIYSARFMGERAYLVTFRQIDPLFVIDVSAPESPQVLGYLKIPGVSDYLHPYDDTHIIGVGRDATGEGRTKGLKVALFDVSDVSNPKEISKYIIGESGTYSDVQNDHKAFLFSREKSLLVLPVHVVENGDWNAFQGAYVFSIGLANGIALKGKITHENETATTAAEKEYYYYDYASQIRRALYIDNVLYTVSQKLIKMNALDSLDFINKVALPADADSSYRHAVPMA